MKSLFKTLFLFFLSILATSCIREDETELYQGEYQDGYFIVNEGPFGSGWGTLTFLSADFNSAENSVYENKNNQSHLGNVVQDINFSGDKAYIVVNNSNKMVITNRYTMVKTGEVTSGLSNPRFSVVVGNYAYVSNWGDALSTTDDYIAVINLSNNTVSSNIPVSEGPEKMVVKNNFIYVLMKGGWGSNNQVLVINSSNNTVENTLTVGDNPESFSVKDNDIYVLCTGKPWTGSETAGSVYKINTTNNTVSNVVTFATTEHPNFLNIHNTNFYYHLNGSIFKWNGSATLPTAAESGISGYFYGMNIHNGKLFTLDANDYVSSGTLKIYDLNTNTLLKTVTTGIIPNEVALN